MTLINAKKTKLKKVTMIISLILFSFLIIFSFVSNAEGAYIGGNMSARYVHDLELDESYDTIISFDLDIEKRIGPADLYLNPLITYKSEGQDLETELEEGYVDLYFADFDLRLGKQKLTWGKADGVVVTNLVNPLDLTEYPAVEFEDKFQAVNAARVNYYSGSDVVELIWIPEFEPVKMEKELFHDRLTDKFSDPVLDTSRKEIKTELENSELAIKYSSLGAGYDYELVAGYFWDDEPTLHRDPARSDKKKQVIVPRHHRLTMAGGSLSTTVGPFVVRGEGAYIGGKYFNTSNRVDYRDGTVEKDQLKLLIAGDYQLGDYLLSLQVLEEMILDYENSIKEDEYTETLTFLVSRNFLRDTLAAELTFFYNESQEDLIARPRISYDYSDKINFEIGANYALDGAQREDVIYIQSEYLF